MNVFEAYETLVNSGVMKNREAVRCFEYKTVFAFELKRKGDDRPLFDSVFSVNKETKKVGVFQPFLISLEEYKSGKEIKNFK